MQRKGAGPGCGKGIMGKKDTWKINRQTVNTVTFGKSVRKAADCQSVIIWLPAVCRRNQDRLKG